MGHPARCQGVGSVGNLRVGVFAYKGAIWIIRVRKEEPRC